MKEKKGSGTGMGTLIPTMPTSTCNTRHPFQQLLNGSAQNRRAQNEQAIKGNMHVMDDVCNCAAPDPHLILELACGWSGSGEQRRAIAMLVAVDDADGFVQCFGLTIAATA